MALAELIPIAISVSIFITVFAIGLHATFADALALIRRPGLFVRSIFSMNIVMVAFAWAVALLFDLDRAIEIAILALAVAPVPPILPKKQEKAGGEESYAIGLLVTAAVCAVVIVPIWVEILGRAFGLNLHVPPTKIVSILIISTILPLFAGMLVRRLAPAVAERILRPVALIGGVLLAIAVLPVLIVESKVVWAMIGNGVLVVMIAFSLVGIVVGHILGGPDPDDRTVLALATSTRHPGIAIAIAVANFPEQKGEILAVILLYVIVSVIVAIPYVRLSKKHHASPRA